MLANQTHSWDDEANLIARRLDDGAPLEREKTKEIVRYLGQDSCPVDAT